jgi:hypothetical protein
VVGQKWQALCAKQAATYTLPGVERAAPGGHVYAIGPDLNCAACGCCVRCIVEHKGKSPLRIIGCADDDEKRDISKTRVSALRSVGWYDLCNLHLMG